MKRLPLSIYYNGFSKRMVIGYVNCKIFRMFYSAHKVTEGSCIPWSQCKKKELRFHLFKARDLSVDTFSGIKGNCCLVCVKTVFVFMDCLKYFEPNSYLSRLESLMVGAVTKGPNAFLFMTAVGLFYMTS